MILFLVLAVLLPWSISRQMHVHTISRGSLIKLPVMFAGIGLFVQSGSLVAGGRGAAIALAISVFLSVVLGVWRGAVVPIWQAENGSWQSKGNRQTIILWTALIACKFLLGTVGSVTGWFPEETVGMVFVTLGLSFAIQNIVVARRSIARTIQSNLAAAGV